MDKHIRDRLVVSGASIMLPDGKEVELPKCYVYEFDAVVAETVRTNYDPEQPPT